jgi:hypothetical protein
MFRWIKECEENLSISFVRWGGIDVADACVTASSNIATLPVDLMLFYSQCSPWREDSISRQQWDSQSVRRFLPSHCWPVDIRSSEPYAIAIPKSKRRCDVLLLDNEGNIILRCGGIRNYLIAIIVAEMLWEKSAPKRTYRDILSHPYLRRFL